jgi:hypothetical protein
MKSQRRWESHLLDAFDELGSFETLRRLFKRICTFETKRRHFQRYGLALADGVDEHLYQASRIAPLPLTEDTLLEAIDRARERRRDIQ